MTQIRFSEPPAPPQGRDWCLVCLMLAKHQITSAHQDLAALQSDGKDDAVRWIPWDTTIRLQAAVCRGPTDFPALGAPPACWTHLAGLDVRAASSLADGRQLPPGLLRGRG